MRAAVMVRHGGPEALEVQSVPDPAPGPALLHCSITGRVPTAIPLRSIRLSR
jgi:hypothetical protein